MSGRNLLSPLFSGPFLYLLFGHGPPRAHRARGGAGPICAFSGAPGNAAEFRHALRTARDSAEKRGRPTRAEMQRWRLIPFPAFRSWGVVEGATAPFSPSQVSLVSHITTTRFLANGLPPVFLCILLGCTYKFLSASGQIKRYSQASDGPRVPPRPFFAIEGMARVMIPVS